MKYLLLIFCAVILANCAGKDNHISTEYYCFNTDPSKDNNIKLLESQMVNTEADNINVCIFGEKTYEIYSGPKPNKDRKFDEIINECLNKSKLINIHSTNFNNLLIYLNNRVRNSSNAYIYTDGKFMNYQTQELLINLNKKGLQSVRFFGVDIKYKESIYNIFIKSKITVNQN